MLATSSNTIITSSFDGGFDVHSAKLSQHEHRGCAAVCACSQGRHGTIPQCWKAAKRSMLHPSQVIRVIYQTLTGWYPHKLRRCQLSPLYKTL